MCTPHRDATIEITVFEKHGGPLTKRIHLNPDGAIGNDSAACLMANGVARRVWVDGVDSLARIINEFGPHQAYAIGRLKDGLPDRVKIVTAARAGGEPDAIARTKDNLVFADGEHGLALMDVDVKGMSDEVKARIEELGGIWRALCSVIPELETAAHVVRTSTSSGLRNVQTGEQYPGSGGFHDAVVIADAADIPRFLSDFHDRLWLSGLGWGWLSAAGSFLERALIDKACAAPERLIFEGPPIVEAPLAQDPRPAVAYDGNILDTAEACPPLTEAEKEKLALLKVAERTRLKGEAKNRRAQWSNSHIKRMVATGKPEAEAGAQVDRWLDAQELSGDFPLPFDNPSSPARPSPMFSKSPTNTQARRSPIRSKAQPTGAARRCCSETPTNRWSSTHSPTAAPSTSSPQNNRPTQTNWANGTQPASRRRRLAPGS